MNLLIRETVESTIRHFRVQQYMLYKELIQISMIYLINHGLKYDPQFYKIDDPVNIITDNSYHDISHYSADLLTIKLFPNLTDYFLYCYIPVLVEETFFKLNGNYFIPLLYIADEPIVKKPKSSSVYSLFHPLTLYFDDNRVTFMKDNYELVDFIQLIIHDWNNNDIAQLERLGFNFDPNKDKEIYDLFSKKLKCKANPIDIKMVINKLIFDNWTYELYETYYGLAPSIDMIIKIIFDKQMEDDNISFSNLFNKRLTFIEPLMRIFFKQVSFITSQLMNGKKVHSLMLPKNAFTKHFFVGLNSQSFYDTVNGFSSIISHKATFKSPSAKSDLPSSISELHESHKFRICSNTISNINPGEVVSLVSDQNIDMRFGIFNKQQFNFRNFGEING